MSLMYSQRSWQPSKSAAEMRSELARERHESRSRANDERNPQTGPPAAHKRIPARRFFVTPWGLGLAAFVVMFLALFLINPPLTQQPPQLPYELAKPDLKKVATYSAIVGALAFLSPYVARYMS